MIIDIYVKLYTFECGSSVSISITCNNYFEPMLTQKVVYWTSMGYIPSIRSHNIPCGNGIRRGGPDAAALHALAVSITYLYSYVLVGFHILIWFIDREPWRKSVRAEPPWRYVP
jgi:hypothetical protein